MSQEEEKSPFARYTARAAITSLKGDAEVLPFMVKLASTPITGGVKEIHPKLRVAGDANRRSRLLASASSEDANGNYLIKLFVYSAGSNMLSQLDVLKGHTGIVHDIVFGHVDENPHLMLSASEDSHVGLWDLRSRDVTLFRGSSRGAMMSCDMNAYKVAGVGEHGVHVWDIRKPQKEEMAAKYIHSDIVTYTRFHPDDRNMLLTGSEDGFINVFDLTKCGLEMEDAYTTIPVDAVRITSHEDCNSLFDSSLPCMYFDYFLVS